jgi:DNA-binding HxlR family transcriptional regulator
MATREPSTETPQGATPAGEGCQVGEVFDLLSRAHMLDITHLLIREAEGPLRFNEIQEALDLSPRTLSERLKALTRVGLVERRSYDEVPPRVEYETTPKARELGSIFADIQAWTERHDLEPVDED